MNERYEAYCLEKQVRGFICGIADNAYADCDHFLCHEGGMSGRGYYLGKLNDRNLVVRGKDNWLWDIIVKRPADYLSNPKYHIFLTPTLIEVLEKGPSYGGFKAYKFIQNVVNTFDYVGG